MTQGCHGDDSKLTLCVIKNVRNICENFPITICIESLRRERLKSVTTDRFLDAWLVYSDQIFDSSWSHYPLGASLNSPDIRKLLRCVCADHLFFCVGGDLAQILELVMNEVMKT